MKRIILLVSCLMVAQSSYAIFDCIKGNGSEARKEKALKGVDKIKIKSSYDLVVRKSSKERIEITGPQDLLNNLVLETHSCSSI